MTSLLVINIIRPPRGPLFLTFKMRKMGHCTNEADVCSQTLPKQWMLQLEQYVSITKELGLFGVSTVRELHRRVETGVTMTTILICTFVRWSQ